MEVTFQMFLIVCPLVFLAAAVDAIGGGGGLIALPAYMIAGLPTALAGGSNKLSACMGTTIATFNYFRKGKIMLKPGLSASLGALPGAWIGAQLLQQMDERFVRIFMLVAIPVVAVLLMLKKDAPAVARPMTTGRLFGCFALGLGCGLYDGFFGPGTGTLLIMGLTYLIGMDMITAAGTAKLINLASNIAALGSLITGGNVLFPLALPAIAFSITGGYLGSWLAMTKGAKFIRKIMLAVIILLIVKLAYDMIVG